MRLFFYRSILLISIFFSCHSHNSTNQKTYTTNIPKQYNRVNDYANIFTDSEEHETSLLLKSLEDSVGCQLAILTIDSLKGIPIEKYSIEVANSWRLGRTHYDDGILITFSKFDRQVRIEVGYGL